MDIKGQELASGGHELSISKFTSLESHHKPTENCNFLSPTHITPT